MSIWTNFSFQIEESPVMVWNGPSHVLRREKREKREREEPACVSTAVSLFSTTSPHTLLRFLENRQDIISGRTVFPPSIPTYTGSRATKRHSYRAGTLAHPLRSFRRVLVHASGQSSCSDFRRHGPFSFLHWVFNLFTEYRYEESSYNPLIVCKMSMSPSNVFAFKLAEPSLHSYIYIYLFHLSRRLITETWL